MIPSEEEVDWSEVTGVSGHEKLPIGGQGMTR